jgi:mannose-6-phosphate isomerase-like protein (cupin superfamily)
MPVIKEVEKLWGTELWHHNDSQYCMKTLMIRSGAQSSLHYHKVKRETFLVVYGFVSLQVGPNWRNKRKMRPGDSFTIEPGVPHRFRVASGCGDRAMVVESSTTHSDEDVVRLEPSKLL